MKLPLISGVKLIKALSKFGFSISKHSGNPISLIKDNSTGKIVVVVPKHKELAKGIFLSIISQSGLNKEELLKKI